MNGGRDCIASLPFYVRFAIFDGIIFGDFQLLGMRLHCIFTAKLLFRAMFRFLLAYVLRPRRPGLLPIVRGNRGWRIPLVFLRGDRDRSRACMGDRDVRLLRVYVMSRRCMVPRL